MGRQRLRTVIEEGRARQRSRYRKPQNEWKVLLVDHHSGYISWEEYVENQKRLEANVACTGVKAAARRKRVPLCCRACCAAAAAGGSCRLPTAATVVECRGMFVEAIEEIGSPAVLNGRQFTIDRARGQCSGGDRACRDRGCDQDERMRPRRRRREAKSTGAGFERARY